MLILRWAGVIGGAIAGVLASNTLWTFDFNVRAGLVVVVVLGAIAVLTADYFKDRSEAKDALALRMQIAGLDAKVQEQLTIILEMAGKSPLATGGTKIAMPESDRELAEATLSLAGRLREFERRSKDEQYSILHRDWGQTQHLTAEDRSKKFQEKTADLLKQTNRTSEEFRTKYLGRAIQLRDELLGRLHESQPQGFDPHLIAFQGFLAGPSPISDAADYLERLARKLYPAVQ